MRSNFSSASVTEKRNYIHLRGFRRYGEISATLRITELPIKTENLCNLGDVTIKYNASHPNQYR